MDDFASLDIKYVLIEPKPSTILFALKIVGLLMQHRFDLVHSHGFTAGICAALPARLSHTVHLITLHDVLNANQFFGIKNKLKKRGMGIILSMIDVVHSVSHDAKSNLLEHFPGFAHQKEKLVVIPNGIEVERFIGAAPRDLKGELGLDRDIFLVGFLGRFMPQKGFCYLVDAIEKLHQCPSSLSKKCLVLTFGEGGFFREEKQAAKARGLEKYFRFMPFTSNVASTIKGLDIIIMPSLWEACPLQPMEALVCGTPIIGTNCIGLREVLRDTPAKVIPTANADALAQALFQEMQTGSIEPFISFREEAIKRFDVKKQATSLQALYKKIMV